MGNDQTRFGLAALCLVPLACGTSGNLASQMLEEPKPTFEDQTTCKVKKSQEKPLIVEWPSADRGQLESGLGDSVVVVAYNGCEMRLLSFCKAPGKYAYKSVTPKEETERIQTEDDLWAKIPMGAARFEAKLATAGQLNVAMTMVGRYVAEQVDVKQSDLEGRCDGATHIIAGLTVGAFEFYAGADAEVAGGAEVMDVGAGAGSKASRETLTRDGKTAACMVEGDFSAAPPRDCAALLRVEVLPIVGTAAPPPAPVAQTQAATPPASGQGSGGTLGNQKCQVAARLAHQSLKMYPNASETPDTVMRAADTCRAARAYDEAAQLYRAVIDGFPSYQGHAEAMKGLAETEAAK